MVAGGAGIAGDSLELVAEVVAATINNSSSSSSKNRGGGWPWGRREKEKKSFILVDIFLTYLANFG